MFHFFPAKFISAASREKCKDEILIGIVILPGTSLFENHRELPGWNKNRTKSTPTSWSF